VSVEIPFVPIFVGVEGNKTPARLLANAIPGPLLSHRHSRLELKVCAQDMARLSSWTASDDDGRRSKLTITLKTLHSTRLGRLDGYSLLDSCSHALLQQRPSTPLTTPLFLLKKESRTSRPSRPNFNIHAGFVKTDSRPLPSNAVQFRAVAVLM
jgi:hypothetical protein